MRRQADRTIRTTLLAAMLALAACERTRPVFEVRARPAELDTGAIAIGTFGSMTGRYGHAGVQSHLGLQLAIDECNARGGIHDRPLALQVYDDQGRVEAAARAGERLAKADKAVLLFGGSDDDRTSAAARASQDVPIVCAPCGDSVQSRAGVFALGLPLDVRARALAEIAARNLGAKSVGVVVREHDDADSALATAFEREFKALGGTTVSVVAAAPAQLDAAFAAWKSAAPAVVVLACDGRDAGSLASALHARDIRPKFVLASAPSPASLTALELAAIESAEAVVAVDPELAAEALEKFAAAFRARFAGQTADESAWLGYEAGVFALGALANTKSYRAEDVRVALEAARKPARSAIQVEMRHGAWRTLGKLEGRP
jgi:branched-chain amino acid transport system substrate-binding protein